MRSGEGLRSKAKDGGPAEGGSSSAWSNEFAVGPGAWAGCQRGSVTVQNYCCRLTMSRSKKAESTENPVGNNFVTNRKLRWSRG